MKLLTHLLTFSVATVVLCHVGCGTSSESSYADLVVIYNAELESLDRLERKRQELLANHEAQLRPDAEDALKTLTGILGSASGQNGERDPAEAVDPHEMLDRAIAGAENAQQAASELLAAATAQATTDAEDPVQYSEELKRQLAAIDEEIEKQRTRVERARQARDAAEPR